MLLRKKSLRWSVGRAAGFILAALLGGGAAQGASVVDFEDCSGGYPVLSRGFDFHGSVFVSADPMSNNPTNALRTLHSGTKMLKGGNLFSVVSLDLQEGLGASTTASVMLLGYRPGGLQVMETFTLDGNPATFETFRPDGFLGVDGVSFFTYDPQGSPTGEFSIDNIVVPEPASMCLLALIFVVLHQDVCPIG